MTPIHSKKLQDRLDEILNFYWKDNTKSWRCKTDGSYEKIEPKEGEEKFSAQKHMLGIYNRTMKK